MKIHRLIIALSLVPALLHLEKGDGAPGTNCNISVDEIYAILKIVIKKEKLEKSNGIDLNLIRYCNFEQNDTAYLKTLLIKPGDIPEYDKNLLTASDIDYMLCTRQKFRNLRWDNVKLGFVGSNRGYYYRFSLPYFNKRHNKVIMSYDSFCPGTLCGSGKMIVLEKKGNDWTVSPLGLSRFY